MRVFMTIFIWMLLAIHFKVESLALAPSTVGGVVASAGKLSNTIKDTIAWKTLTAHPNALVGIFPARAMEVVREVVGSFRKEGRVIIETPQGRLRGKTQLYKSGNPGFYYSFRGIRYGLPPVGARRFRAALPEKRWKGVRDALREGNNCPHKNMILETFKGNEDCLFLNVFTTKLPDRKGNPKLPVMVWFHGGGYSFGSGNTFLYGPDFLVAENVVLVTLNYRLGPIGFLSVDSDAPGNAGLKDQVLALKWVQENIYAFGGDPNQVTIFGESAGGSSVQYLMLSPMAKGLFHRAISESGSAYSPWAMAVNPQDRAFRLGRALGFKTNSTKELLAFLRRVPVRKLIESASKTITPEDTRRNIGLPFVPSIEGAWNENNSPNRSAIFLEEPFMIEHPSAIYRKGNFNMVPYITGYNSHEAMLFIRRLRRNPALLDIINHDFVRLVPSDLNVPGGSYSFGAEDISRQMRDFYLGTRPVSEETIEEMIFLFTDIMFLRGIIKSVRMHAAYSQSPVYMYRFAFDGSLGLYKRMLGISRPGVCHGDELGYLFHFGFFNLSLDPTAPEILVKKRMVKMWTNFAKYGDPTPLGKIDPTLAVKWESISKSNATQLINYLDITARLEPKINPESQRLAFWDEMYTEYNGRLM